MVKHILLALALLSGFAAPAAAQAPAAAPPPPGIAKAIAEVASSDGAVQEAAAVALGKTGDRKTLPLLEALREGSVLVRSLPGGKKDVVIVGDKITEGDKTLVPLFTAYGKDPILAPDGKPLLVELSTLEEVATGRSLRLAIRPLIDAFSGNTQLADADWTVRKAAATKMGNSGDLAALPALAEALAKEKDRWVRYELEQAVALIRLKSGSEAERTAAATALGDLGSADALDRLRDAAAESAAPAALRQAAADSVKRVERWALLTSTIQIGFRGCRWGPSCS